MEGDRASSTWREIAPDARRKSSWQERHEIPQQKWTSEESQLLAHLVTQHTDAKGHPMWIRIAPLLNGRTPQACSPMCTCAATTSSGGCTLRGCHHVTMSPCHHVTMFRRRGAAGHGCARSPS